MKHNSLPEGRGNPKSSVYSPKDSLVASFDDLPGWTFILSTVGDGECGVVVYDSDWVRRLSTKGSDLPGLIYDARTWALESCEPHDERGARSGSRLELASTTWRDLMELSF